MVQKPCMRRWGHHWTLASKKVIVSVMQTIFDPVDCSPPGSSVHGVFQARILEWGAIVFLNISLLRLLVFSHSSFIDSVFANSPISYYLILNSK